MGKFTDVELHQHATKEHTNEETLDNLARPVPIDFADRMRESIRQIASTRKDFLVDFRSSLQNLDAFRAAMTPPKLPISQEYFVDLPETESPYVEINENLHNIATNLQELREEQINANQQSKSAKRIAVFTAVVATGSLLISGLDTGPGGWAIRWITLLYG